MDWRRLHALDLGDLVDHGVENTPPGVQIVVGDSLGSQALHQQVSEGLFLDGTGVSENE